MFFSYGKKQINLVEIKKDFSRGGHFHKFQTSHFLITGKIECREKNLVTNNEKIIIFEVPSIINVNENVPHLFTALEDSLFVEIFENGYSATDYHEYRQIVECKMNDV